MVIVSFFFKQKTAYEMHISDWSSDVCSSDLAFERVCHPRRRYAKGGELLRIDDDLILAHHAADARDLGDARNRFEFEAQEPVLEAAQLGKKIGRASCRDSVLQYV